jgi:GT2 family glycosyltransferase
MKWLERGLEHFSDEGVAGISGFFYPSDRGFRRALYNWTELQLYRINWISTMNCIIRKSRWEEYPFNEDLLGIIPETKKYGGEDYDWTLEMVSRGFKVVLDPNFSVVHTHEDDLIIEMMRNIRSYFIYKRLQEKIKRLQRPSKAFKFTSKRVN